MEQHKMMLLRLSLKILNSTAPLENWNLTALLNVTEGTVMLFEPSVSVVAGPKYQFPFAVVLATLKSAPPGGKFVTFIVKVCAA